MINTTLDWTDNIVDSRDIEYRIDELQDIEVRDEIEEEELRALREFRDEAMAYASDWRYGITFISDGYWIEYAKEVAEDTGAYDGSRHWPYDYIDWERAADALKMDYTSIEFEGKEFWYRP